MTPTHARKNGRHAAHVRSRMPRTLLAKYALVAATAGLLIFGCCCLCRPSFVIAQEEPESSAEVISRNSAEYTQRVEPTYQHQLGLSAGCEAVSLSIVLNAMDIDITAYDIVDNYLEYGNNSLVEYVGNPYGSGWALSPAITSAANKILVDCRSSFCAFNLTGSDFSEVMDIVDDGYPLLLWVTDSYDDPQFEVSEAGASAWYYNEHCVVVYGRDTYNPKETSHQHCTYTDTWEDEEELVLVCDPLVGKVAVSYDFLEELYGKCGSMAVAIW